MGLLLQDFLVQRLHQPISRRKMPPSLGCPSKKIAKFDSLDSLFEVYRNSTIAEERDCIVCRAPENLRNVPIVTLDRDQQICEGPKNGTDFRPAQPLFSSTDVIVNDINTVKCTAQNVVNSSLKHGEGSINQDGSMLIKEKLRKLLLFGRKLSTNSDFMLSSTGNNRRDVSMSVRHLRNRKNNTT